MISTQENIDMYRFLKSIDYDGVVQKDLTPMLGFSDKITLDLTYFSDYIVADGETPEILAQNFYNNPKLSWVILALNDMTDAFADWCLFSDEFEAYVIAKYGALNVNAPHHYELDGYVVVDNSPNSVMVDNYTYEDRINTEKRKIKVLDEAYLPLLEKEIKRLLG